MNKQGKHCNKKYLPNVGNADEFIIFVSAILLLVILIYWRIIGDYIHFGVAHLTVGRRVH